MLISMRLLANDNDDCEDVAENIAINNNLEY